MKERRNYSFKKSIMGRNQLHTKLACWSFHVTTHRVFNAIHLSSEVYLRWGPFSNRLRSISYRILRLNPILRSSHSTHERCSAGCPPLVSRESLEFDRVATDLPEGECRVCEETPSIARCWNWYCHRFSIESSSRLLTRAPSWSDQHSASVATEWWHRRVD